jgi:Ca2+-binding RTX toxin-like protein
MRFSLLALATSLALTVLFAFAFGCAPDADVHGNDVDDALAVASAIEEDPDAQPHLCERLQGAIGKARVDVDGRSYRVFTGTPQADRIEGSGDSDVIFGLGGDDKLFGNGGNDVICAGGGRDYVEGGLGQDRIYGEAGADILHGGGAGDFIHGGAGDDEIWGDVLDDKLYGDDGDDLLVGGHGTDRMEGGAGDDWLRGDTNGDAFLGGVGDDVVSFMTARPTGRATRNPDIVMDIDLPSERANGDGADEEIRGVERVIGSAFRDRFRGDVDKWVPGRESAPAQLPLVFVDARARDTGLVALGSRQRDDLTFARPQPGVVVVTETQGRALFAGGEHCEQTSRSVVTCRPPHALRYVMAWGDDGADTLRLDDDGAGWPRDFEAHLDGGDGDDHLVGSSRPDVLFSGRSGADVLDGRGGDDALISESYAFDRARSGAAHEGGADTLLGRGGNDQLVSDYPCGGHYYSGGEGVDIAGFARVGDRSIRAQLRGPIDDDERSPFFGKAFLPGVCNVDAFGTHLEPDLEILEGSKGDDVLLGTNRRNVIWGRQGNDVVRGYGGGDVVYGHEGRDTVTD